MKLFLCPNCYTSEQIGQARDCIAALEAGGRHICALSPAHSAALCGDSSLARFTPGESDLILSLGGDGAILRAAQVAIQWGKPLFGINSGSLGYLSALELGDVGELDRCLSTCPIIPRSLLEFVYEGETRYALNDVVLGKGEFGETVGLTVRSGNAPEMKFRGDGVILATPTGSTSYTLSAGGPWLAQGLDALAVTPICSHTAGVCPMVVSGKDPVTVHVDRGAVRLYADGAGLGLVTGDLTVRRSARTLALYGRRETGRLLSC